METDNDCVEIMVLNKKSKEEWTMDENNKANLKFIELNVQNSKISSQLKYNSSRNDTIIKNENYQIVNFGKLPGNKNLFSKIPKGTVLSNDCKKKYHEIQQKLISKEEIKINDNNNDSAAQNEKHIKRNVKNKTIVEVRRNPTRLSKKNFDKDFVTSRQKLISTKRKENFSNSEANKRIKLSNTVYMNTRSVTKKLDTIGSTSQTPSIYDLIDWKEWPAHGMHERPVFHLEHGLGIQYMDQFIKKIDSTTDLNNSEELEMELSESQDHDEDFLRLKKLIRQRIENLEFQKVENSLDNDTDIFQTIMHSSLHLVLGFCTQISSNEYQTVIQNRLKLLKEKITIDNQNDKNEIKLENSDSKTNSLLSSNNSKSKNISNNTYKVLKFISARMEPAKCLITPRKSVMTTNIQNNSMTNIQNNCSKLQDIIRGSSKNALILLKIQDPMRVNSKRIENSCPLQLQNNQFIKPSATNSKWNASTISNDSTMNITSFYENFIPLEEMNYLQECGQSEKTEYEINDEEQNKIDQFTTNINDSSETVIAHEYITGSASQNCDFQNVASNFGEQRKLGMIGDFYHHKPTAFVDENTKIKDFEKNEETMEALDLSTVRSTKGTIREEITKSKKETIKPKETIKSKKENIKLKQDSVKSKEEILKSKKETKSKEEIVKSNETITKRNEELINKEDLQILLENTIILYCIITGVNQENVANYIDTLNATETLEWLKENYI